MDIREKVNKLEYYVKCLKKRFLTKDQYEAIKNANNPSKENPFCTKEDINSGGINSVTGVAVDNTDPLNPVIQNQSWLNRYEGVIPSTVIGTTWVDLTPIFGVLSFLKQPSYFDEFVIYNEVNQTFECNSTTNYHYSFSISLALTGSLVVAGQNDAVFEFAITRPVAHTNPNFAVIRSKNYVQSSGEPTTFLERELYEQNTFVFEGGNDPYQVSSGVFVAGFKIQARKLAGQDMDLVGNQDIRFSKQ